MFVFDNIVAAAFVCGDYAKTYIRIIGYEWLSLRNNYLKVRDILATMSESKENISNVWQSCEIVPNEMKVS